MSCADSTSASTKIEIPLTLEAEKLIKAQENIPAACEESLCQNHLGRIRKDAVLPIIRAAVLLFIFAAVLITVIVGICTGDTSKLSAAVVALNNVALAFALNNGTST